MKIKLEENEIFYFDAEAADRPIRFIEKFCIHYEGKFAGKPFILEPVQKEIVRDIYGWKYRDTGMRRFTDCYFEAAVGAGKSPLMAALGLFGLMADGEIGAQVYSLASTYGQARVVFDAAKRFVQSNQDLARRTEVTQFEIRHPGSGSFWRIVSGKGPGAGCRPSTVLADEVHEWPNAGGYNSLRDRMAKRQQPLMFTATNAGETRSSFCWQLREKAIAAINGKGDPGLYPIIWCANENAATDDVAAWREANPLIGITISLNKVQQKCDESLDDPDEEATFRRLYLGIWPTASKGRWLDLSHWDACVSDEHPPADATLYIGLDLSQGDDLCAAAMSWVTPARLYLDARFWLPEKTAEYYIKKHSIPYDEWAAAGYINLLTEPTISQAVRYRIAAEIIAISKTHTVKAVCYDRYRADDTIAALEGAGIICIPIPQGYSLSPGCRELERRLKERSATVTNNPVLRFCAENTEVKEDDRGNIWPAKPSAKGKYAGKKEKKIDGITAMVTSLTEARKHSFPAASKQWKGHICVA